jgi:hypothetical protein
MVIVSVVQRSAQQVYKYPISKVKYLPSQKIAVLEQAVTNDNCGIYLKRAYQNSIYIVKTGCFYGTV